MIQTTRRPTTSLFPLLVAALLTAGDSHAAGPDDLLVSAIPVAQPGDFPVIILKAKSRVAKVVVDLRRSDGETVTLTTGKMRPNETRRLKIEQPEGKFRYEGEVKVHWADGSPVSVFPFELDAIVAAPPTLRVEPSDVLLEEDTVMVTMSSAVRSVRYSVLGDDGKVMDRGEAEFTDTKPGQKVPVRFNHKEGVGVLRIDLVGHDVNDMYTAQVQLSPWSLEIPHEDVLFPMGESTIPAAELAKIKDAVDNIQGAVRRYGKLVKITLFIEGHTDSVGGADMNQQLSQARAHSIAKAVRAAGVRIPIKYSGFGEGNLKVKTGDETDEPQNRRAVYMLSADQPRYAHLVKWHAL